MKRVLSLVLSVVLILLCVPSKAYSTNNISNVQRYTVLVLDTSSSSSFIGSSGNEIYNADTAIDYVKKASLSFLSNIGNAPGNNYVAVVSYRDSATVISDFSTDYELLTNKINQISASSNSRSIADGLYAANDLLSSVDDGAIKNVVLFTTGMTNTGNYTYSGRYNDSVIGSNWRNLDTQVRLYAYANEAHSQADIIKSNDITLYTIGLFQTMEDMPLEGRDIVDFFKLTTSDLATSSEYYNPVDNPDKLEFTFGEVAKNIVETIKKITFTYQSGDDYEATCYYTDNYFSDSSYIYNPSLATMSISFAMSAFGSSDGGLEDYSDKSKNARSLLSDIGFEDIQTGAITYDGRSWFELKPTTDSIAVIVGNKPIFVNDEDYTLIALAVRGGGYESEWASNFTIGANGQHNGFDLAKKNVIDYLKTYISNQNITGNIKLWITGFSRAAATANLVGGAIDDGISIGSDISYDLSDVFTYCFETPAGALTSQIENQSKYKNIFNIINSSDPVPYVAPAALGFRRYGVDRYLPSAESSTNYNASKTNMLKIYNSLPNTEAYIVDDFQMKKLKAENWLPLGEKISFIQDDLKNNFSQGLFLSNYVTYVARDFIVSRNNYVSRLQNEIREICSVMFGCTDAQRRILMDSFISQAKDDWGSLALSYFWNVGINPWGSEEDALQIVSSWLKKAVIDAGVTDYDADKLDSAGKNLADLMLALVVNHPNYLTTAIMNGGGLGAAHYPELCYSWLASMDKNYVEGAIPEYNNGGYKIIRINCDVDVKVIDAYDNMVASIVNEEPQILESSSIIYGIDEDGQKYVVLPVDLDYQITIVGREDDNVNYSINEYSAKAGNYTRSVNYFDIPLKEGEYLTGHIPAFNNEEIESGTPEGSSVEYSLLAPNGDLINIDSDLLGDDAVTAYYKVTAVSENPEHGLVTGSGSHQYGQFAQLEAFASEGYIFASWVIDDEVCSTSEIYRFCVTEDVTVLALFKPGTSSCEHKNIEIKNNKEATCTEEGYTGDKICTDCDETIENGAIIQTIGHSFENGSCRVCGIDNLDYSNTCEHLITELRDKKDATIIKPGYSGDKVCIKCGKIIESGTEVHSNVHILKYVKYFAIFAAVSMLITVILVVVRQNRRKQK